MRFSVWVVLLFAWALSGLAGPILLDDQFDPPRGFHIYRAAGPELTGGSYDIAFDGQGRLLVGDGNAIRRLKDADGDGVFDGFDIIASNLGWRGPQGILVYGDRLYAVGGDGIQLYEGYQAGGALQHKGRIGNKFLTGGDHDAHTIFRGHDGYLYFMAGNGAGISKRSHITEATSPALNEREASIFRISPDGKKWECVASGGRNPPNLGMNYLGELFSFDSDMEWHVGLPWYRPVRLNHWVGGGDQGWQEVGAYPPYYIDCLPGILDVGRGSPTWGIFYEHTQLPGKYRNAYLVCDYRWKRESDDQYATTGRLVAFFLKRNGTSWTATTETLVRPKPGARDSNGKLINFALVDVDVAPDGSLFISDHNQGVWRLYYGERQSVAEVSGIERAERNGRSPVEELLALPQPGAEWSRVREEAIRKAGGEELESQLRAFAVNTRKRAQERLRAIRLLAPAFAGLPLDFIDILARDGSPEIRGQAAHLLGIQGRSEAVPLLCKLLRDNDAFVRRRSAEALQRLVAAEATDPLIERLGDSSRIVRYTAMIALAHQPTTLFFDKAAARRDPQVRMRALVAGHLRSELPSNEELIRVISSLLDQQLFPEDRLDFLRIIGLFQKVIETDVALKARISRYLASEFVGARNSDSASLTATRGIGVPRSTQNIRWEQIRLLGEYQVNDVFSKLLRALETEDDPVTQFHIAQSLARLSGGWSESEGKRLVNWFVAAQHGWFAEFSKKGVEFPQFWMTVLSDFAVHHRIALLQNISRIDFAGLLGTVAINALAQEPHAAKGLITFYENHPEPAVRLKVFSAMTSLRDQDVLGFCRSEYTKANQPELKTAALKTLAGQSSDSTDADLFFAGLTNGQIEIVRVCAKALSRIKPQLSKASARALIGRMSENNELCKTLDSLLKTLTSESPSNLDGRLTDAQRTARVQFWRAWYEKHFGTTFEPLGVAKSEKTDEELLTFLLSNQSKGDRSRGAQVYERLQCHTCHGGGTNPGREGGLFGPDLAGVTRRLAPKEFAEALVYPSRQVAERYKAHEITLKDGMVLTGFITEQNDSSVTLATRDQVRRLNRSEIGSIQLQTASLMPDHLLNNLSLEDLKALVAFLDEQPAASR